MSELKLSRNLAETSVIIKILNRYLRDHFILLHPRLEYILPRENIKEFIMLRRLLLSSVDIKVKDHIETIYSVTAKLHVDYLDKAAIINLKGNIEEYGAVEENINNY